MYARRLSMALVPLVIGLLAPATAASAVSARVPPPTEFEAASNAEQVAVAQVQSVRARRTVLEARVQKLNVRVGALGDRARQRATDLARVDQAQRNVEARLLRSQLHQAQAQARARRAAAEMYRTAGGTTPPLVGLVTGGRSIHDVSATERYLAVVGERITRDVNAMKLARREVVVAQRQLQAQRLEVERAAIAARIEQDAVVAIRTQQDRALGAARTAEVRETRVLAAATARRVEFERSVVIAQAASGTITDILRSRPGSGPAPTHLQFPADGPVTSGFGPRLHPIFHTMRIHTGIDIGASYGASVHASASGVVVVAGTASGYGNAVVIDHGGGIATLYGHLSRFRVKVGQTVAAGETVGAVGDTGNSTGAHLHFEVRVRGVPVDPMPYL